MFNLFLSLLFPRRCVSCGKFGKYFCEKCIAKILKERLIETAICPVCKKPAIDGATHPFCKTRYTINGLASILHYRNEIKRAIKTIKYKRASDIAGELSNLTIQSLEENKNNLFTSIIRIMKVEKPILVPIPLHWWKKRSRWFNQTEILGKYLANHFNLRIEPDLLIRNKSTKSQTELKLKDRMENVKGIFSINPNCDLQIKNYSFLVFDDVWTTGSTAKEAGKILKRNGAKNVWVLTIAR